MTNKPYEIMNEDKLKEDLLGTGDDAFLRENVNLKKTLISIKGCDDTTRFFVDLEPEEIRVLKYISELSQKVPTYNCMLRFLVDDEVELRLIERLQKEVKHFVGSR
jgi:hypothetical protein